MPPARVLIVHGYLLGGSGSNVYNASLTRVLVERGHEVHLVCQEDHPERLAFVDRVVDCEGEALLEVVARPPAFAGRCTVYRPAIGRVLPVFVRDRYERFEAVPFGELSEDAIERHVEASAAAVRAVARLAPPDFVLANHALASPEIVRRALDGAVPYVVKVHGSDLEYALRPHPRLRPLAEAGVGAAAAVLVGSADVARRVEELLPLPGLADRVRLGPPGVDVRAFAPRGPARAGVARLRGALAERPRTGFGARQRHALDALSAAGVPSWDALAGVRAGYDHDGVDAGAPDALDGIVPGSPLVVYVGKLIVSKGVELLLAAWPLVRAREPRARLVIVGYGAYREGLELLLRSLDRGDLEAAREIAGRGRELEGGPSSRLDDLADFLDGLPGQEREEYLRAAHGMQQSVVWLGRLGHDTLVDLLPAATAQVVPSTLPEAFGMVAAEAAAAGAWPVVARHSGLAEVAELLGGDLPAGARPLLAFDLGPRAVPELAHRLVRVLNLPDDDRTAMAAVLRDVVVRRLSWDAVADTLLAAGAGRLGEIAAP